MPDLVVHAEGQGLCADHMDRHVASEHLEQGGAEKGNLKKFWISERGMDCHMAPEYLSKYGGGFNKDKLIIIHFKF